MAQDADNLELRITVVKATPPHAALFLKKGGNITAAATPFAIDLSTTDAKASVALHLDSQSGRAALPLSSSVARLVPGGNGKSALRTLSLETSEKAGMPMIPVATEADLARVSAGSAFVALDHETRLTALETRIGTSIDGTLAVSESGFGTAVLMHAGMQDLFLLPLTYGDWKAHSSVLGISKLGAGVVGEEDLPVVFMAPRNLDKAGQSPHDAEDGRAVQEYADAAWRRRNPDVAGALVYGRAPMLHKAIFSAGRGIGGSGYDVVPSMLRHRAEHISLTALEDILASSIAVALGDTPWGVQQSKMLSECTAPGISNAKRHAEVVGASLSVAVSYLMPYRADGRTRTESVGEAFVASELWSAQVPRVPGFQSNDCDGSASMLAWISNRIREDTSLTGWIESVGTAVIEPVLSAEGILQSPAGTYSNLRAVRNTLFPWYEVGTVVLGASASHGEAAPEGGAGRAGTPQVQGHAIAMAFPARRTADALLKGEKECNVHPHIGADVVHTARVSAHQKHVARVDGPAAAAALAAATPEELAALPFLALEGTVPAAAQLVDLDARGEEVQKDNRAATALSPTVGRILRQMHVGGGADLTAPRFYVDMVEASFDFSSPWWQDKSLRTIEAAACQFVFVAGASSAGASPQDIYQGNFGMVPLVSLATQKAAGLDQACARCARHVMPSRTTPIGFATPEMASNVAAAREAVHAVQRTWEGESDRGFDADSDRTVVMIGSLSSLLYNKRATAHMCKTLSTCASVGSIDFAPIRSLVQDGEGNDVAYFLAANAAVRA